MSGKTNYEGLSVSATTQNRLSGFNYDPAGNMTQNGAQYFYDAENHMTSAGGGYSYLYDGRVPKFGSLQREWVPHVSRGSRHGNHEAIAFPL